MSYDPNSTDAMFSRIIQRLDAQDSILTEIRDGVRKTNGRVNGLEKWRDVITGKVAGISFAVSAVVGVATWLFSK
jgi:hypothetical protein